MGCLDSTKWRGSPLPESCQSLSKAEMHQESSNCVLQHGPPQYDIFFNTRCVRYIQNCFLFIYIHVYTQKKAGSKNKSCHVNTISDYLTVSTDTLWCSDHGRVPPSKPHTHMHTQGHHVYPTFGKWSVIENSWTAPGRNGERKMLQLFFTFFQQHSLTSAYLL